MAKVIGTHEIVVDGTVVALGYELYPGVLLTSSGGTLPTWRFPTRPHEERIVFVVNGWAIADAIEMATSPGDNDVKELCSALRKQAYEGGWTSAQIPEPLPPQTKRTGPWAGYDTKEERKAAKSAWLKRVRGN